MKRLTRAEVQAERMLEATRSMAVLGVTTRGGEAVVAYLKEQGFDVFPVRTDARDVAGVKSWVRLDDVPGSVDLVLVLDGAVEPATIDAAAEKSARMLWVAPGVGIGDDAEERIAAARLVLVRNRDIVEEHRHTQRSAGQPRKRGVNVGARRRQQKARELVDEPGFTERGGGGHKAGGGVRAVLDEKKMVGGKQPRKRR